MRTIHILGILALLALAVPAAPAHAGGVVTVCDEAHLLAALAGGGTVTFACSGTIILTATITIAAETMIDGSGQTVVIDGNYGVRTITVIEDATLELNHLTITHGITFGDNGGGILNYGTLIINNSVFSHNYASETCDGGGGAIYNEGGTLVIASSVFSSNIAYENCDGGGGAIHSDSLGVLAVNNCIFDHNEAHTDLEGGGGAIYNDGSDPMTFKSCVFLNNHVITGDGGLGGAVYNRRSTGSVIVENSSFVENFAGWGGGIYSTAPVSVSHSDFVNNNAGGGGGGLTHSGTAAISNSSFVGNYGDWGGAVYSHGGLTVTNSAFSSNSADYGGGINSAEPLTITNSTFSSNSADYYGGGIRKWRGPLAITNSTFSDNSAIWSGGGLSTDSTDTVIISNSTFSGNTASDGGSIANYGPMSTVKNTIIAGSAMGGNCAGSPLVDGGGNLSYPDATCPGLNADPLLGPLQDNGGPTWTMALGEGSAAIDAADDAICAAPPVNNLDQRSVTRPQGTHCDIGAVEQVQEPVAVRLSTINAGSTPGTVAPTAVAGLLLLALGGCAAWGRHQTQQVG